MSDKIAKDEGAKSGYTFKSMDFDDSGAKAPLNSTAFKTSHRVYFADARETAPLGNDSVDLVVTSPPYPMISMWDDLFTGFSPEIAVALKNEEGMEAFELMHKELDRVWRETVRLIKPGGFLCINIGDAVRTLGGRFQLYTNHSRILQTCLGEGLSALPLILWRKQTNAPNKFMGSGMLPAGAYVTLEHEYILIFRKGGKRLFKMPEEKAWRRESSYFWEERNSWFSDTWDFKGTGQSLRKESLRRDPLRERSAAYPLDLAERLILMYSLYGDTVYDPFIGTGTTARAAAICGRNSAGLEIDSNFADLIFAESEKIIAFGRERLLERKERHIAFMEDYTSRKGAPKYRNEIHDFPVITRQETDIRLRGPKVLHLTEGKDVLSAEVEYETL